MNLRSEKTGGYQSFLAS